MQDKPIPALEPGSDEPSRATTGDGNSESHSSFADRQTEPKTLSFEPPTGRNPAVEMLPDLLIFDPDQMSPSEAMSPPAEDSSTDSRKELLVGRHKDSNSDSRDNGTLEAVIDSDAELPGDQDSNSERSELEARFEENSRVYSVDQMMDWLSENDELNPDELGSDVSSGESKLVSIDATFEGTGSGSWGEEWSGFAEGRAQSESSESLGSPAPKVEEQLELDEDKLDSAEDSTANLTWGQLDAEIRDERFAPHLQRQLDRFADRVRDKKEPDEAN